MKTTPQKLHSPARHPRLDDEEHGGSGAGLGKGWKGYWPRDNRIFGKGAPLRGAESGRNKTGAGGALLDEQLTPAR